MGKQEPEPRVQPSSHDVTLIRIRTAIPQTSSPECGKNLGLTGLRYAIRILGRSDSKRLRACGVLLKFWDLSNYPEPLWNNA